MSRAAKMHASETARNRRHVARDARWNHVIGRAHQLDHGKASEAKIAPKLEALKISEVKGWLKKAEAIIASAEKSALRHAHQPK